MDHRFFNLQLSHLVQGIFSFALVLTAVAQIFVYLKQADIMQQTIQATIRPFLKVKFEPSSFSVQNGKPCMDFSVENTGKLPAFATVNTGLAWEAPSHSRGRGNPQATSTVGSRYVFEGEKGDPFHSCGQQLSDGELLDLKNGIGQQTSRVFIAVVAIYGASSDIIHTGFPYETHVCNTYQVEGADGLRLRLGGTCPEGDDAPAKNFAN
jgi:hypothetical protein